MHLLATTSATLDDIAEAVDLQQSPADIALLSFTDSDLTGFAQAWESLPSPMPSIRLVPLKELRHPMSVDLWIDKVGRHSRLIVARILGGYEWWAYGCEELSSLCKKNNIRLALLPGEDQADDPKLLAASTLDADTRQKCLDYFRQGGRNNLEALSRYMLHLIDEDAQHPFPEPSPVPKCGFYHPAKGIVPEEDMLKDQKSRNPAIPIFFYRSGLLAADCAPIDALYSALEQKGYNPVPVFVPSLKDNDARSFIRDTIKTFNPPLLVSTTAFASGTETGKGTIFDETGLPVFQAVIATTRDRVWKRNLRGLNPADIAMHIVLPELDGRILAGALSFKSEQEENKALEFKTVINQPVKNRVEQVARRIDDFIRLKTCPRQDRKIVFLIPHYPGAQGRTGYAVGLDVPQSILAMMQELADAGYHVGTIPQSPKDLLDRLKKAETRFGLDLYADLLAELPREIQDKLNENWGRPEEDEDSQDNAFAFQAVCFGNITVALAPDRGRKADRRADYHDPVSVPRHALTAFGLWMQKELQCHAIVHMGAHGTLEWLPGKAVALSETCFPEIVTGSLPVIYPFIVSNPGEAAVAKRRIAAVTLGHLPPVLTGAGLSEHEQKLEQLVDEYAQAEGLDARRRDRLAALIVETARETGLAKDAGIGKHEGTDEALARIDNWLCDLKDFNIKDGQHIFGRVAENDKDPLRIESAGQETQALIRALDGWHITAGPAGSPSRGRQDVLPTGRNLFAADPRAMPTSTAYELGKRAADEVIRRYVQDHGEPPKTLVLDLWGSASLRTGGEEISQGLALMGCEPIWDKATGRVTGISVLPPAALTWPRIDVTFKISGLFRDMFPGLITLLDTAVHAVAQRTSESAGFNPLAESVAANGEVPHRIFGSRPGFYGTGIEDKLASGEWSERTELGQIYLDTARFAYGGADAEGIEAPEHFARQIAQAEILVHTGDDPARDILEGSADVAFIGGFASAVAALGNKADIITLDTTNPDRPRARSVAETVTRIVRARAANPKYIEGQMRHGPRGASDFAETVDRLVAFCETTENISGELIETVYDAYLEDEKVRDFLFRENPEAAEAIIRRFMDARRRNLWPSRRNSIDYDLSEYLEELSSGK